MYLQNWLHYLYQIRKANEIKNFNLLYYLVLYINDEIYFYFRGGNAPSYVYRLISELYHPDDYDL